MSGYQKKSTEQGALTYWRWQRERLVRTPKEIDRSSHTHELETAEGATCQDTERNRPTELHSLTGDGRGSDLSGHRKKSTDRGALTSWRRQRERLVRTSKEINRLSPTHELETAEGATCQDTERNRLTDVHSLPGDGRGSNLSGCRKKSTDRGALTCWRRQRERLVRTNEVDQPRHTHDLETAEGATCQDTERNRLTEPHSLPGDGRGSDLSGHRKKSTDRVHSLAGDSRGSDLSGHRKKSTDRGALTTWRRQRE